MRPDILEQLYTEYYGTAFAYTFSLCRDRETAEDIVSDAFVKAFLTADNGGCDFKFWLLTVCRNLWIDAIRKSRRRSAAPEDEAEKLASPESVEDGFFQSERNRQLYRSINTLPANYREALILFYFADLPVKKISSVMRLSESNVKTILCRARIRLKQEMEENENGF